MPSGVAAGSWEGLDNGPFGSDRVARGEAVVTRGADPVEAVVGPSAGDVTGVLPAAGATDSPAPAVGPVVPSKEPVVVVAKVGGVLDAVAAGTVVVVVVVVAAGTVVVVLVAVSVVVVAGVTVVVVVVVVALVVCTVPGAYASTESMTA